MRPLPGWHPLFVHFPLSLGLIAAALLFAARLVPNARHAATLGLVGTWNIVAAAVGALSALGSGLAALAHLTLAPAATLAVARHVKWALGALRHRRGPLAPTGVNRCARRALLDHQYPDGRANMGIARLGALATATLALAGCLKDGHDAAPTTYNFLAPTVGFARNYQQAIVDNSNNTINEAFSVDVTTVNSDGSYVLLQEDTTGSSPVVNGTTYTIPTETIQVNNESQDTSYTALEANGTVETCAYDPNGPGPGYPLTVGNTWTLTYTLTCGTAAPVTYTQTGNVLDVESVTVPAGTYTAIKLQSTVTWTTAGGTTITETVTNWRDIDTLFSVQQQITRVYSGTLPTTGYPVSETIQLTSEEG